MSVTITPLTPGFVGEVAGIDLTQALTADHIAAIEAGMDQYAVLVFHDQRVTDEQQIAFSRNFGPLEPAVNANVTALADRRLGLELADISNLDKNNQIFGRDSRQRMFNLGNQLWHSDASFRAVPAKYSLLSARAVTSWGGNTEFADMRAAWDALDDATQQEIETLICEHSLMYSRGVLGFDSYTDDELKAFRPVRQSLVRRHPVTGRKSLFLSAHIGTIIGWPVPEARAFVRDLTEHATQRKFVHAHQWRVGDLVIWDNRTTMHRARRYPDTGEARDMRRTTIMGDGPTTEQIAA